MSVDDEAIPTVRVRAPHDLEEHEAANLAKALEDALGSEYGQVEWFRLDPDAIGGPGFETIVVSFLENAPWTIPLTAFATKLFSRLADDAHEGLRRLFVATAERLRQRRRRTEPTYIAFRFRARFEAEPDVYHRLFVRFPITSEKDLEKMIRAAGSLTPRPRPDGVRLDSHWHWDPASEKWVEAPEAE